MGRARTTPIVLVLVASVCFGGCGGHDTDPVGRWSLDRQAFVASMRAQAPAFASATREEARALSAVLERSVFEIRLDPDLTFEARQEIGGRSATYRGRWRLDGVGFTLEQTHVDGSPQPQTLQGTLFEDRLRLYWPADANTIELLLHKQR